MERVSGSKQLAVIDAPVAGGNGRVARPDALAALQELFGHNQFRTGQIDVIERVLDGIDTLAIIPTGGGKSLTYQLPAMLVPGVTLVVSPLIALMKDQVENAPASVRDRITLINSDIDADERHRRLALVRDGVIKLLYVAPERLLDPTLRRSLITAGIARIVIDEAHCISLWGHDFRPDYLTIPLALRDLGNPPVLAVTATATPEMADQIASALGREMELVRTSVFRENLFYEVVHVDNRNERIEKLIELCKKEQGSGIVYVSSRKDAESFAETLRHRGVQAAAYHAGMPRELRGSAQERFMAGQTRVMVATVAFGMGVDKANVRFIIHMMPPGTVESYAQESGRAGRDGRRSRCILLTASSDRATLRARARRDLVPLDALRRTYVEVRKLQRSGWSPVNMDELRWSLNQGRDEKDEIDARVALGYLQQAELIARAPDAPVRFWVRRRPSAGMPFDEFADDDPLWTALLPKLGDGWQRGETIELDAAEISAALAIEPAQLDALLGDRPEVQLTRDQRTAWYRLLPAPTDAARVMDRLLDRAKRRTDDRIDQMMTYIDGHECRHRMLAAALGEAISPCGDACDVCDPARALVPPSPAQKSTRSKRTAGAADALLILRTIPDLPYAMGKRGLVWLLSGSPESRLQADRSQAFGALTELGPTRIGRLIDQLVEAGFLEWRIEGEYRLVGMTSKGAGATRKDMELLPGLGAPATSSEGLVDLAEHDRALYDRLVNWRSQEASEQKVPPYVIAHNTMLREIARVRPSSPDQLLAIGGFGRTRVDRYGEAIVRIVTESRPGGEEG
jgi:ATP-dependent DNA helicase RecQ